MDPVARRVAGSALLAADVLGESAGMHDFDQLIDRHATESVKWGRYAARDIIPMWVADMDFSSPPAVLEALHARVDHGVFGYPSPPAELIDAVLAHLAETFDWRIAAEWIVWLPGLVTGLSLACRAVGAAGDDVLTAIPVYPPFLSLPRQSGRNLATVPLRQVSGRWSFDFDRLAAAITERTRLFLLCSPHNPVGTAFTAGELARLAEICLSRGVVICSDEIHNQLLLDENLRHIPTATLGRDVAARTITLLAPSKTYNIAGLGCSLAIIPDAELRAAFRAARAGIVPGVNVLGYAAALAAYREGADWLAALLAYLRDNRDLVEEAIGGIPRLAMTHVAATYLAWIDAREMTVDDPARFYEEAGVGLSSGRDFGTPGYLRLNFACPRDLLREALGRMERVS